jgi:hypothetical protein
MILSTDKDIFFNGTHVEYIASLQFIYNYFFFHFHRFMFLILTHRKIKLLSQKKTVITLKLLKVN